MVWKVQLVGDSTDLSALATSLTGPQLSVTHDGQDYILSFDNFHNDDDASTIHKKAQDIIALLNGASRLALEATEAIKVGAVFRYADDGTRKETCVFPEPVRIQFRAIAPTIQLKHADGTIEEFHPADPIAEWLPVAINDNAITNVLKILASGSLDWVNLYAILEIVKDDVGGSGSIVTSGWASKKKMKLFKHTANSPAAIGVQSRHGASKNQPPPKPMKLSEARVFINAIIHAWLENKTNSPL